MFRTQKSATLVMLLLAIGLLVVVFLVTLVPWTDTATAQVNFPAAIPAKTQLPETAPLIVQTAQTYFSAQALVFVPLRNSTNYHEGQAGCRISDGVGDYFASVNIPHGSLVDTLEVVYYVANPNTPQATFVSLAMGTDSGGWQTLSPLNLSIRSPGYHLESIGVNHTINTYNNSYSLYWYTGGSDVELCQVRLYYRPPVTSAAYLPVVNK